MTLRARPVSRCFLPTRGGHDDSRHLATIGVKRLTNAEIGEHWTVRRLLDLSGSSFYPHVRIAWRPRHPRERRASDPERVAAGRVEELRGIWT